MDAACPSCAALRLLRLSSVTAPADVTQVGATPVVTLVAPVVWTCGNGHPVGG